MGKAAADFATTVAMQIAEKTRRLQHNLFDTYHPERHYMRGPGPKWREKHGQAQSAANLSELGIPGLWNAGA
jgi:hypothetical protein